MSGTGGGGGVGKEGFPAECRAIAASRRVLFVGSGSGKVVFTGCWSCVRLVFAGADPSCRSSVVVVVVAGSNSCSFVVEALWAMVARRFSSWASTSKRNNI